MTNNHFGFLCLQTLKSPIRNIEYFLTVEDVSSMTTFLEFLSVDGWSSQQGVEAVRWGCGGADSSSVSSRAALPWRPADWLIWIVKRHIWSSRRASICSSWQFHQCWPKVKNIFQSQAPHFLSPLTFHNVQRRKNRLPWDISKAAGGIFKFQILFSETEAGVGFAQNQDLNQLATALGQGQRSGSKSVVTRQIYHEHHWR